MTGIFYGSSTGNTADLAKEIAGKLDVNSSDVYDVASASVGQADGYDCILLGSSTWGMGELQDDWYGFLDQLKKKDLSGKKVGLFGCGDSASYPDTFCDALGIIHEELENTGCAFIGEIDAAGYSVTDSKAFNAGNAIGLLVDDDEPGQTAAHMDSWIAAVKNS